MRSLKRIIVVFVFALALGFSADNAFAVSGGAGGGTANGGSSGSCSGCGASGPIIFYELKNVNKGNLGYSGIGPQLKSLRKDLEDCKLRECRPEVAQEATNKYLRALGCFERNWKNNGCPLWVDVRRSLNNDNAYYKLHSPVVGSNNKMQGDLLNITTNFNVKVWRENPAQRKMDLIFERRLGYANESRSNARKPRNVSAGQWRTTAPIGYGTPNGRHVRWLRGHTSNAFSNSWSSGSFGAGQPVGNSPCRSNWNRGKNGKRVFDGKEVKASATAPGNFKRSDLSRFQWCYWEGNQIGPKAFKWATANGGDPSGVRELQDKWGRPFNSNLDRTQFGPKANGAKKAGLKESIFIKWKFNLRPQAKNGAFFDVEIEGAPGLFYVVQIVATDYKQNIVKFKKSSTNFVRQGQIFKVYTANKVPEPDIDCTDPRHPNYPCPEIKEKTFKYTGLAPRVNLSIDADTVLQTRENSTQSVILEQDVNSISDSPEDQMTFPHELGLAHYSPQINYSSGTNPYNLDYVNYGSTQGTVLPAPNNPIFVPTGNTGVPSSKQVKQVHFKTAAALDPENPVQDTYVQADYSMSWLQPTLDNPCIGEGGTSINFLGFNDQVNAAKWPNNINKCELPPEGAADDNLLKAMSRMLKIPEVNVWDDELSAFGSWESRWRGTGSLANNKKDPSEVGYVQGDSLRCGSKNESYGQKAKGCTTPVPLLSGVTNASTQHAQGAVNVAAKNEANPTAPLRVRMPISASLRPYLSSILVYPQGAETDPQALPKTGPIINSVSGQPEINYCRQGIPADTRIMNDDNKILTRNNWLGDPNCRGYAIRWQWDTQAPNSCQAVSNINNLNTRIANFNGSRMPSAHTPPNGFKRYNTNGEDKGGNKSRAYNDTMLDNSAPFTGKLPGRTTVDGTVENNYISCGKNKYYLKGAWRVIKDDDGNTTDAGWGKNNNGKPLDLDNDFSDAQGVYLIDATFTNVPDSVLNHSPAWRMIASYDGFINLDWFRRWESVSPWRGEGLTQAGNVEDGFVSDRLAFIKVYGPKNSR